MSLVFNGVYSVTGGGGSDDTYAFLIVTYPAGSTCTASDGTTTLTAPDTGGSWVCKVPNAGTWTVSCTDGTRTASTTVSITTEGQREEVVLTYTIELYNAGVFDDRYSRSDITTNCTKTLESADVKFNWGNLTMAYGYLRWVAVDLTGYSTITLRGRNGTSGGNRNLYFSVWISQDASVTTFSGATDATHTGIEAGGNAEIVLDVTNRTGVWYVAAGVDTNDTQWTYGRIGYVDSVIVE